MSIQFGVFSISKSLAKQIHSIDSMKLFKSVWEYFDECEAGFSISIYKDRNNKIRKIIGSESKGCAIDLGSEIIIYFDANENTIFQYLVCDRAKYIQTKKLTVIKDKFDGNCFYSNVENAFNPTVFQLNERINVYGFPLAESKIIFKTSWETKLISILDKDNTKLENPNWIKIEYYRKEKSGYGWIDKSNVLLNKECE